ncbi:MAG: hypothetical protein H6827_04260, partial [Planctomycetes bacterium]|nr:hypothetical protein [Planctomycetota bacterium]
MSEVPWIDRALPGAEPAKIEQAERIVHGLRLLAISAHRDISPPAGPTKRMVQQELFLELQSQWRSALQLLLGRCLESTLRADSCWSWTCPDGDSQRAWKVLERRVGIAGIRRTLGSTPAELFQQLLRWGAEARIPSAWLDLWRARRQCLWENLDSGRLALQGLLRSKGDAWLLAEVRMDLTCLELCTGAVDRAQSHWERARPLAVPEQLPRLQWLEALVAWVRGSAAPKAPMRHGTWPASALLENPREALPSGVSIRREPSAARELPWDGIAGTQRVTLYEPRGSTRAVWSHPPLESVVEGAARAGVEESLLHSALQTGELVVREVSSLTVKSSTVAGTVEAIWPWQNHQ